MMHIHRGLVLVFQGDAENCVMILCEGPPQRYGHPLNYKVFIWGDPFFLYCKRNQDPMPKEGKIVSISKQCM
jgi:hypothetical protein